ncbi:16S rRNA (cytidine(1402)-2'-O)-methyltransferase [Convivina praedatoris]|uniref:Ribosomal RNA small subunit methyltransferase I n=1 Tax=Convivina praedatoris TaxID=2880963 RepID=A0ABN8H7T4_9LACO|nr:16S rRNA (cytidine(1402)-2'-O)-methyltransferase [Convivina sp. LMG 32447]CAH1851666.1 Ribosomal RNA small subunit methyltransferase I [Convivina sp. LMG 32447]CAH1851687.1 Ribosomal RNA small subunit methyltransferase I [Convivina sp. LMG 32447]CAH1853154.1 Ribosomal RNA small subunit methyltransferase I [Convivina sp. LMG 32447]
MQVQKSFEQHQTGTLYLIPTPIGNLQDISQRALSALAEVDLIAAEDTRHTQQLLNHFEITTKQTSFHEHNWQHKIPELICILQDGQSIGQVSDAGMPSISDPGKELVAAAIEADIPVVPLPGPSAGIVALIASGLVPQPFYFHGFLSRKKNEQMAELAELKERRETVILYEAPHRLIFTLSNLVKVIGPDRSLVVARELTKRYEEFLRGAAGEILDWVQNHSVRGEFVIMIAGNSAPDVTESEEAVPVVEAVGKLVAQGLKPNAAIKQIARERQLERQSVYRAYHQLEEES